MKTTLKSFFVLIAFMAMGSFAFAQSQKQPLPSKAKPHKNASTTTTTPTSVSPTPANSTTNTNTNTNVKVADTPTNSGVDENTGDLEQQRGAINEQGIQNDQPKLKPATSTSIPVAPTKPKTESNTTTVSPK